jgi:hypothetical protein
MALSANQKEEAYIQAFIKTLKDLAKNGDQLNGVQLKGVEGMTKWMTQMSNTNTVTKANLKIAKDQNTLAKKQQQLDLVKKKMDEVNIRLRHGYKLQEEKEHGEQVRRNIQLRQMHENFTAGFNMLKKSLFGGFGFQAAIGTTVKKMAGMTRNFNELQVATEKLQDAKKGTTDADKEHKAALADLKADPNDPDKASAAKKAEMKLQFAMLDEVRAQSGKDAAEDMAKGTQGKMSKPIFEKLGKMGEFLGKKAVPIGIGMGVAGVLMSVIVKAFSASPLFGAMMKLMKFMVTLILMPIGTFFGALLRPILIMLLRKFIVPFYSHWMPVLMNLGTEIGTWITELTPDKIATAISNFLTGKPTGGDADGDGIADDEDNKFDENPYDFFTEFPQWWEEEKRRKQADYEAGNVGGNDAGGVSGGDDEPKKETEEEELARIRAEEERVAAELAKELQENPTVQWDMSGENPMFNGKTPNDIVDEEAMEKEAGMYSVEQEEKDRAEAAAQLKKEKEQAAQKAQDAAMKKAWEDHEKRLQQEENQKRLSEALAKPAASTGADRMAAQAARNAQQETVNTVNPKYAGTPSEGKLSRSLNAGADVGAKMAQNATMGHVNLSSSNKSNLKPETIALLKSMGVAGYAQGFDGMINSPTLFMAGESGAEHVKVTPNGQGGGGNITVNIQNMNGSDDDLRKLKKTILEVIQQSSANRGRL